MKIQMLELEDIKIEKTETKLGFWKRQFQSEETRKQKVFDWCFGVVLPVICFVADPIVFKGYGMGKGAFLGSLKPFAYLLSFTLVMMLSARLIWMNKLKWSNSFLSGLFAIGAIISFGVGVVLLPFSILGLAFVVGILGFTPLFSGFVYLRNSVHCFKSAKPIFKRQSLIGAFVLSAVLSFTLPMLVNVKINKSLEAIKNGDENTIRKQADNLQYVSPLINFDALGGLYCQSPDSKEHKAIAETYERFTGESIERIDFHICEDW